MCWTAVEVVGRAAARYSVDYNLRTVKHNLGLEDMAAPQDASFDFLSTFFAGMNWPLLMDAAC